MWDLDNGIDLICKAEIETDIENKHGHQGEKQGVWDELDDWDQHIYTIDTMYKTDN